MTKKQEVLLNLIERIGLERTVKSTGLSLFNIYNELDGHLEFTSDICLDLLEDMFNNTSLLKQTDEYITLDWGVFTDGICTWFYNNEQTGEKLTIAATPFWDGEPLVPVNIEDYVVDKYAPNTREWTIVYQEYAEMSDTLEYEYVPEKFGRLNHLINWFNNVYFEDVKEIILDGLEYLRNNAKEQGVIIT
jgi:hypothetical protein